MAGTALLLVGGACGRIDPTNESLSGDAGELERVELRGIDAQAIKVPLRYGTSAASSGGQNAIRCNTSTVTCFYPPDKNVRIRVFDGAMTATEKLAVNGAVTNFIASGGATKFSGWTFSSVTSGVADIAISKGFSTGTGSNIMAGYIFTDCFGIGPLLTEAPSQKPGAHRLCNTPIPILGLAPQILTNFNFVAHLHLPALAAKATQMGTTLPVLVDHAVGMVIYQAMGLGTHTLDTNHFDSQSLTTSYKSFTPRADSKCLAEKYDPSSPTTISTNSLDCAFL